MNLANNITETINLAKTIIIKVDEVARAMNNGVMIATNSVVPSDKRQWKYYMNLAGKIHPTNNDVMITLLETGNKTLLSQELFKEYTYSHSELLKLGNYYDELIATYPDDILFIHGCLFPVDIDTAIEAETGTILNYNRTLVEESEYSLIRELESYIKLYFNRWHVVEYGITDELYLASLLAVLYCSLPNKIQNLRLSKVNTAEVHSFHLEMFFSSRISIWQDLSVVNKETLYWLYRNINRLTTNVGQEETFRLIAEKVFGANNIGLGEFVLRKPNIREVEVQQLDKTRPAFQHKKLVTVTQPLNNSYTFDDGQVSDITSVVNLEMTTDKTLDLVTSSSVIEYYTKKITKDVSQSLVDDVKTKILDLNVNKTFQIGGSDQANIAMDIWALSIKRGNYNSMLDFTEPNNGQVYNISPRTGFLMLIKLLMLANGMVTPVTKYNISTILTTDKDQFTLHRDNIWDDLYNKPLFDKLHDELPQDISGLIRLPIEVQEYITQYLDYYKLVWLTDANAENFIVSANLKVLMNRNIVHEEYNLSPDGQPKTIDELLLLEDIEYDVPNTYDILKSISVLMEVFTGYQIDNTEEVKNVLNSYINILNKLTSYTTHSVVGADDAKTISIKYNNPSVLRTQSGLMMITEGGLFPLEDDYVEVSAKGNDFINAIHGKHMQYTIPRAAVCISPIKGVCTISPQEEIVGEVVTPVTTAVVQYAKSYDTTLCTGKQIFLLGIDATFESLSQEAVETTGGGNTNSMDSKSIYSDNAHIEATEAVKPLGIGQIDNEELKVTIPAPTITGEVR